MSHKDRLIHSFSNKMCKSISKKTIRKLQALKEDNLLSGDDSGLKNVWDEICVQVQLDESVFWELYEGLVYSIIYDEVESMEKEFKQAIWLETENGKEWAIEEEDFESNRNNQALSKYEVPIYDYNDIPAYEDDIAEYILNEYVYYQAQEYSNNRIEKYLWEY